jgi:hypothetical protein
MGGSGAELVISGSVILAGNNSSGNWGGAIFVGVNGSLTLENNVSIEGNTAGAGGGVVVQDPGTTFTMNGGTISGNYSDPANSQEGGGGVEVYNSGTFILNGGRIQGTTPSGGFAENTCNDANHGALFVLSGTAKWGTGGTYTKAGATQTGGAAIASTDDTLIAIP